jgi:serine O-acetyltransferase
MSSQNGDPVWDRIREEVSEAADREPMLANFLYGAVLNHDTLGDALSYVLAAALESLSIPAMALREMIQEAHAGDPDILDAARADIHAVCDRDPASPYFCAPLLYFKGYHAIQSHRVSHYFWGRDRKPLALYLQSRISQVFAADIHPAAQIGKGILVDHATSVVIGETAVVEDNVSMLHEVTLGGTGKVTGDRHPKVRQGVLLGAGAKILGNVEIGEGAKVASGSVVLQDVEPHTTVAGVPAVDMGAPKHERPALEMDHRLMYHEVRDSGEGI